MDEGRLEGENHKQWLAFCCFRDLGSGRSTEKAYKLYAQKLGIDKKGGEIKASSTFIAWRKNFNWEERAEYYDQSHEERKRMAMYESDSEAFTKVIDDYRKAIDNFAQGQLADSIKIREALSKETQIVIDKASRTSLDVLRLTDIVKTQVEVSKLVAVSSERLEKSLAISLLLTDLQSN